MSVSDQEPKGSFIRWQAINVAQLTYAINLVLTFAVATLGFQVTLLVGEKFSLASSQKCVFGLSLLTLAFSVLFGLFVVVNRLRAFRATMRAARARENIKVDALQAERELYKRLDHRTWWLFWWQIGTFAAGIALTIAAVLTIAGQKLL
jgi:hypothetical protein